MNIKKIIVTLVFVVSLFTLNAYAKTMQFTMGDYDVKIDEGEFSTYTMEVAPYTVEGRTMVPVRIISEKFGAEVNYIPETEGVEIKLGDKAVSLTIGEDTALVDGQAVKLDVPSVETNGRTLVPLRFVSEALDFDVKYVAATEQILITNDPAVIETNGSKISIASFDAAFDMYMTEYGESYGAEAICEETKAMLSTYAVYEAEANKWDVPYPFEYRQDIEEMSAILCELYPGTLDAVWADLLEIEYRATDLNEFLYQIYMPDAQEVQKYYEENYYAAKHILVEDEADAKSIASKLNKGSDFDKLMNENTLDKAGLAANPDGYVFTTGDMVEAFENGTKELKIGQVSGVVESEYGFHIIKRLALPELDDEYYESVSESCALDRVAKHFDEISNNANINYDNYTIEKLLELCE